MEITQNLHKKNSIKSKETRLKILLSCFLVLFSCTILSQDSIPQKQSLIEKKNFQFQELFFKAITQKAIKNYKQAIENLEECNAILPNTKSVLFEFSKNYFFLNNYTDALNYAEKALALDITNIWILEHLVAITKKQRNFSSAIKYQIQLAKKNPKKRQKLVYLHLQNNNKEAAKKELTYLKQQNLLNARLRKIRLNLQKRPVSKVKSTKNIKETNPIVTYNNNKSFKNLRRVITYSKENKLDFLKYTEEGLVLYPAQPFVYLMNGKALNKAKKHKRAIEILESGIDFILDNSSLEKDFYKELLVAYKGLKDSKNIEKIKKKLKS